MKLVSIILLIVIAISSCSEIESNQVKEQNNQRIVVIIVGQNDWSNYSTSDVFVVDTVEIGKVDSVGIVDNFPVYYISIFSEYVVPVDSKIIGEKVILSEVRLNLLNSGKREFKTVDTIIVANDFTFSYSFEIKNLDKASESDIVNLKKDILKLENIEKSSFSSISISGQEYKKMTNSENSFGPNKVFVTDGKGGGSFVSKSK